MVRRIQTGGETIVVGEGDGWIGRYHTRSCHSSGPQRLQVGRIILVGEVIPEAVG
jgi:hypothetical protein